jgi:hypothetical protein
MEPVIHLAQCARWSVLLAAGAVVLLLSVSPVPVFAQSPSGNSRGPASSISELQTKVQRGDTIYVLDTAPAASGGLRRERRPSRHSATSSGVAISRQASTKMKMNALPPFAATNVGLRPTPRLGRSRGPLRPAPLPRRRALRA